MHFEASTFVALLPALALAQYGGYSYGSSSSGSSQIQGAAQPTSPPAASGTQLAQVTGTATTATVSASATLTINVGTNGTLTFDPENIVAEAQAVLAFNFFGPKTHSVSNSPFGNPCKNNGSGFYSGKFTEMGATANNSVFQVTVTDTQPIWLFCGYPGHCGAGMAAVVNQPSDKTLDMYKAAALKVGNNTVIANEANGMRGGTLALASSNANNSASGTTSTSTSTSTSTTSSNGQSTSTSGTSSDNKPSEAILTTKANTAWLGLVMVAVVAFGLGGI